MTKFTPSPLFGMVFVDLSQFVREPLRTGVQRVLMKVIEHLPRERIMPFSVLDEDRVAILDPALFDFALGFFRGATLAQRALVSQAHGRARHFTQETLFLRLVGRQPVAILDRESFFARADTILNLEAFSWQARSAFYISCPPEHRNRVVHFIHDLLVFEQPEVFPHLNWRYAIDYVKLFEAYCAAGRFLVATEAMADKVAHYFNRSPNDVTVVHFGGDLGGAAPPGGRQAGGEARRSVVVVGTIEPRKYPREVAEALWRIAAYHQEVDCTWIGRWGWVDPLTRGAIEAILASGRIRHREDLPDAEVSARMAAADVGVYVSSQEGFGLPVIEFAAYGVKLVTNAAVPAAQGLDTPHAIVLEQVGVRELVAAIETLLALPSPGAPYYGWSWADCAREILAALDGARPARAEELDGAACWRCCARLMREWPDGPADAEQIGRDTRSRLHQDQLRYRDLAGAGGGKMSPAQMEALVAGIGEVAMQTSELGPRLIHWADLLRVQDLLADLIRALLEANHLSGLGRAFTALVGRPIDARAASEAVRMDRADALLLRIIDLAHSQEARAFLGAATAAALCRVVGDVREALTCCLDDHIDLFVLNPALGLPPPTLEDVILADDLLREGIDRLEMLLYFSHARATEGDSLDLFLEVAAGVCRERGLHIGEPQALADSIQFSSIWEQIS